MICPQYFIKKLIERNILFFTGVPCSYLTPLIDQVILTKETDYVVSSSEGDALAMASGAWLAGKHGVVMCQNSGLGNMVNPLTSLNAPFNIPVLLLITWRGKPGEIDEPQHEVMGRITTDLLNLMEIPWSHFPETEAHVLASLDTAISSMKSSGRPYALILKKNAFSQSKLTSNIPKDLNRPSREEVLSTLLKIVPENSPIIATTGKTGRELYTLNDHKKHLYCVGSMGYANAMAHGIALNIQQPVFIIDGDGAAIMHLGNLTSIGASGTQNLIHIVLDNGTYDSTGGQTTVSNNIDFISLARSVGYKKQIHCNSLNEFAKAINQALTYKKSTLIYLPIETGSMKDLERPKIKPHEVARRLQQYLTELQTGLSHDKLLLL